MSTDTFESNDQRLRAYRRNGDTSPVTRITVAPDETRRITIGTGETLTRTLIDIRAPGAAVEIVARGTGWELSHIAAVGTNENPGGIGIEASVPDADGAGIIRDVYLGDGNADSTAIEVSADHAGRVDIVRVFARSWTRGFNCSPPGNPVSITPTGAGGAVRMGDCHAENIDEYSFRFGSSGSICQGCVAKDGGRCFWERWSRSDHADCNARGIECWFAGNPANPKQTATATVRECRGTGAHRTSGPGVVDGEIASNPDLSPPDACPTTTAEALLDDDELASDRSEGGESFTFIDPEDI